MAPANTFSGAHQAILGSGQGQVGLLPSRASHWLKRHAIKQSFPLRCWGVTSKVIYIFIPWHFVVGSASGDNHFAVAPNTQRQNSKGSQKPPKVGDPCLGVYSQILSKTSDILVSSVPVCGGVLIPKRLGIREYSLWVLYYQLKTPTTEIHHLAKSLSADSIPQTHMIIALWTET